MLHACRLFLTAAAHLCVTSNDASMIQGGLYQIEIAGRCATIHVTGNLLRTLPRIMLACAQLPESVEILRLDCDRVDQIGERELVAIDELRRTWQSRRRGTFRMAFALVSRERRGSFQIELAT